MHSPTGDGRGSILSGHGKKQAERGALTLWRQQKGLVRTRKETDRASRTHKLETAEGATCQDTERNRPSDAHSRPGYGRWRDLSGYRKKQAERDALTNWRQQREGLIKTRKETDRVRGTHVLETAERGICQDTERSRPSKVRSLPGDGSDLSGYEKKQTETEQGTLTPWRRQSEGLCQDT